MGNIIVVCIALLLYIIYNSTAIILFGVPHSLSETYYLYNKKNGKGILFSVFLTVVSLLLLPVWLEVSKENTQFLVFLGLCSLCFTAAAPAFKNTKMEDRVHTISAIIGAICSLLWVIFNGMWTIILAWTIIVLLVSYITKTIKTSYIYWLETIAFMSTFTALLVY